MMNGICHVSRIILLSLICILNSGCSLWQNRVGLDAVVIDAVPQANDNSPVAVDIVAIADASLVPVIQALSASQWFNAKSQYLHDYPDGLRIWSLELVPDSHFVADENPLQGAQAQALLLFARYRSEGEHRLRLDNMDSLHLLLMTDDAVLAPEQGK
ncbi:TPA: T6SS protein Cts2N [Citrobacter freundii]